MDVEEGDEVEREIDIVYTGQYSNDSKIFQFPLIPKNTMNLENINSLNVSENMKSMKMELNINQKYLDKNNYNAVPIHTLNGEKIENNSNLCLGMLKNNKLFLTPISQIFQFRHDFTDVNKEKSIKIKKDKKDIKNLSLKKEEKAEVKYIPLTIHQPNSIDSKIALERITTPDGELTNANYMSKEEYLDFLLKYVITPDTGGDSNDDFISLYKNNFSKETFLGNIEEAKDEQAKDEEDKMIIEKENEKEIKKSNKKVRGFNSGIDVIKNNNNEKKIKKGDNGNGIVYNIINNIYGDNECLYYDILLENICQKMNIFKDDKERISQIKNEIDENCIIVKENICFIKDKGDNDIQNIRHLLIKEIGNRESGLKKQEIKQLIEQNGLSISDNKLTKLLQKICKYSHNLWVIKPPIDG